MEPNAIEIKPLDCQGSNDILFMPNNPFQMMVIGSIQAGKTTLLINLLLSKNGFNKRFNKVVWCSPTAKLDEKVVKYLCNPRDTIITPNVKLIKEIVKRSKKHKHRTIGGADISELELMRYIDDTKARCLNDTDFVEDTSMTFFNSLMDTQMKVITEFGKGLADNVLVILDDCVGDRKTFTQPNVVNCVVKSRHYKITTMFLTQAYYAIPKTIRLNCGVKIVFNLPNEEELKDLYSENTCDMPKKEFIDIFRKIHLSEHQFVVTNHYNPRGRKLSQCFTKFISNISDVV